VQAQPIMIASRYSYAPWRRVKSGEYRIIYRIDGNDLHVDIIGKRNDDEVYRLIKRFLR